MSVLCAEIYLRYSEDVSEVCIPGGKAEKSRVQLFEAIWRCFWPER